MEYLEGGELYNLLRFLGSFDENIAKFVFAEIILALQYLHENANIFYRDIKPENILLTKDGHIKLIDFGLCKEYQGEQLSYTFAGTTEYLAPEIILKQGYSKSVDFWALGILLYELVVGYPPFQDKNRNFDKICQLIIQNQIQFPKNISVPLQQLILSLLKSDPNERLGAKSFEEIKKHEFFENMNWENLHQKNINSPIVQYTQGSKIAKATRPRAISETPVNYDIKLPHLQGLSFDQDFDEIIQKFNQPENNNK